MKVSELICTSCGTCAGTCPNDAINIKYCSKRGVFLPEVNYEKCNKCGICERVCPGIRPKVNTVNNSVTKSKRSYLGDYLKCYTGYSSDDDIRLKRTSGGLITALLIYLFENNIIDGAIVVAGIKSIPVMPHYRIIRKKEEVLESSKSLYCLVPLNLAIKEILKSQKNARFAYVGLPCHIEGLSKAEEVYKDLTNKIVIKLGLFCSLNKNLLSFDYLLKKLNIDKNEEIIGFEQRGNGWMGDMSITYRGGEVFKYPFLDLWGKILNQFFIPLRCTLCVDLACELADVSFGDIYYGKYLNDEKGTSVCVVRSERGNDLIQDALKKSFIKLEDVDSVTVINSQSYPLKLKKEMISSRKRIARIFGEIPELNINNNTFRSSDYLRSLSLYFKILISRKRILWPLIPAIIRLFNLLDRKSATKATKNY